MEFLIAENIGAVIVVEKGAPIGIVTERDLIERVFEKQLDVDRTSVKEIMTSPIISIGSSQPIKKAMDLLRDHHIRRLVVMENDRIIGITTERRMLDVVYSAYLEQTRVKPKDLMKRSFDKPVITYLSTYPPRECGIATFTNDLVDEISRLQALSPPIITAINDRGGYYDYPSQVKLQIEREEPESYIDAAKKINESSIDAVNVQHEYGLFGGVWGDYLIDFLETLKKPVTTTLHTILQDPPPDAERVMKEVLRLSNQVVILARVGAKILEQRYDTLVDKIRYIPHGCPNVPKVQSSTVKEGLGLDDRFLLSSFGLINRGKGLEYAIQALPTLVEKHPNLLYLIIGETHPEVRKHEGESYRQSLIELTESLGLSRNVRFVNRFLSKSELIRFLQATDVYILAYPNKDQISSGTLLYALCTGKAIVSTPFLHAEEVIGQGAAMSCGFKDPDSISRAVGNLMEYEHIRTGFEERAYRYSRDMIWPNVAMRYVNIFYQNIGL
ncbi:CBS domain-containing protein [Candidatus Bathyarchaeota archaeon]|nr:CBS domain-containing protein [Candidatus Bathyarchaeota archaeon]